MKKSAIKKLAYILSVLMLFGLLSGCDSDGDDSAEFLKNDVTQFGMAFIPKSTSLTALTGYSQNIGNIIIHGDTLFFTSILYTDRHSLLYRTAIFSVDITDVYNLSLKELTHYSKQKPSEAEAGGVLVTAMQVDTEGNIWVAEVANYFTLNLPDGFIIDEAVPEEIWEYYRALESYRVLRKLDSTGNEILSIDVAEISGIGDLHSIIALNIDDDGNVFIGSGQTVYVLNSDGENLFALDSGGFIDINGAIMLACGSIAILTRNSGAALPEMRKIDLANEAWGENLLFSSNVQRVFPGSGGYCFFYSDGLTLFGADANSNDVTKILDWADVNIASPFIDGLFFVDDEQILLTVQTYIGSLFEETSFVVLTVVDESELPDVTVLTIPGFGLLHDIPRSAILYFNETNDRYRIEIVEYFDPSGSDFGLMLDRAENRLLLDIMAGSAPDIISSPRLFNNLANSGLFEDLNKYIDSDPELSHSDLMEDVFQKTEVGGALYRVFPYFSVRSLWGNPAVVGDVPGWNLRDIRNIIEENPQAEFALGKVHSFEHLFYMLFDLTDFIDWEAGTTSFDSGYFVELIELVHMYYSRSNVLTLQNYDGSLICEAQNLIEEGNQLILSERMTTFTDYMLFRSLFSGDIISKGFSTDSREKRTQLGIYAPLSISSASRNKEGAWEFVRMFLTEDWQLRNWERDSMSSAFPTNKNAFERMLVESMNFTGTRRISTFRYSASIEALSQGDIDSIMKIIDAVVVPQPFDPSSLLSIVLEGVLDFKNGVRTAEDSARIIQSRASIYVAERVW